MLVCQSSCSCEELMFMWRSHDGSVGGAKNLKCCELDLKILRSGWLKCLIGFCKLRFEPQLVTESSEIPKSYVLESAALSNSCTRMASVAARFLKAVFVLQLLISSLSVTDMRVNLETERSSFNVTCCSPPKQMNRLCGKHDRHLLTLIYSAGYHRHVPGFSSQQLSAGIPRGH